MIAIAKPAIVSILFGLWLNSCIPTKEIQNTVEDATTKTVNALNDAIEALQAQSASWQQVLQDAQSKLTEDVQSTVRNEIANLASRSVAQAGVELRCNADFVGDRVRQGLIRIKAEFLDQPVPPVEPALCQVVPLAIDRALVPDRLKQLEIYGYDFDSATNLSMFLERTGGGRANVTGSLDRPTHYAMTLKFGATGCQLTAISQRLVLEWGGRQISTIGVIQPATPICQSKVVSIRPGNVTFVPPRVGHGNEDFSGNGPEVYARVFLEATPQSLAADVYMNAKETISDWTEASGSKSFPLFTPDPGWQIDSVVGDQLVSKYSYTDSNHTTDSFDVGSGGPVQRFEFVGDTPESEAGTRTKVDVVFNEIRLVLTQSTGCVSERSVRNAMELGLIRPMLFDKFKSDLDRELQKRTPRLHQ